MPPQLTRMNVSSLPADQRTCSICQETLGGREGGDPVKTACNHVFDRNCIQHWLDADHNTCPICREEIRNVTGGIGGVLRDGVRDIRNNARRNAERAVEEREAMLQAQRDYGDNDDSPPREWAEYEPVSVHRPEDFNHPVPAPPPRARPRPSYDDDLPREHAIPSAYSQARSHVPLPHHPTPSSSNSSSSLQQALTTYTNALHSLELLDHQIISLAQRSYNANVVHHRAEHNILNTFLQYQEVARTGNREAIELAEAVQASAEDMLNQTFAECQRISRPLWQLMERRQVSYDSLEDAREAFAVERLAFAGRIEEGSGGESESSRSRGQRQSSDDDDGWEDYSHLI